MKVVVITSQYIHISTHGVQHYMSNVNYISVKEGRRDVLDYSALLFLHVTSNHYPTCGCYFYSLNSAFEKPKILIFKIYLSLVALSLLCCSQAFSTCEWGLCSIEVHRLLIAVASLIVELGLGSQTSLVIACRL